MKQPSSLFLAAPVIALVLASLALQEPTPRPTFAELDRCPAIASVEVIPARGPLTKRVIHLLDWHLVGRERWQADLLDLDPRLTDEQLEEAWSRFLGEVEATRAAQYEVIRWLADRELVLSVGVEGMTAENADDYRKLAEIVSKREELARLVGVEYAESDVGRSFRLQIGAAGRARIDRLVELLPIEDEAAHAAADPIGSDGLWRRVPMSAVRAREEAIVRNLLAAAQPNVVVILGQAHDLREPIQRLSCGRCEYVRVRCRTGIRPP